MRRTIAVVLAAMAAAAGMAGVASAKRPSWPAASVADAVEMTRIQYDAAADGAVAAISSNGEQAVFVVWRGDIKRNTNVYELRLVDLRLPLQQRPPRVVLTRLFPGERQDQDASPVRQLRFVNEGKSLAYLGRDDRGIPQAYVVDLASGRERQLTHHPSAVRNFVVNGQADLIAYSAVEIPTGDETTRRLEEDGVFLWDQELFPGYRASSPMSAILLRNAGANGVRQYFLAGEMPKLIFDSRQSRPPPDQRPKGLKDSASGPWSLMDDGMLTAASLSADPSGARLLLYPFQLTERPLHPERYNYYRSPPMDDALARRVAGQVAIVDVATGKIAPLVDAPSPQYGSESGSPFWSTDGRSVLLYTLFPDQPDLPPAWAEMNLVTHRLTPLGLEKDWKPVGWATDGKSLVITDRGDRFVLLRKGVDGRWDERHDAGGSQGFNPRWPVAANGVVVLGVKDTLRQAPELVAFEPGTGKAIQLTDLNPQLRRRNLGEVSAYHWRDTSSGEADGFLIKPLGFSQGKRYPLVILLDDGMLGRKGEPYFLDAAYQLGGHAVQMLAAQGFVVLYHRMPQFVWDVVGTPEEPRRLQHDVEAAVAQLDREGLIDPANIGISGFSRAGYYTSYMLIHSKVRFAAASMIDGGGKEYTDYMRPLTDKELQQISAPLLFEPHGVELTYQSVMSERMTAFGKPSDILYFQGASHQTTRPQHRLRSLGTHIDWWRFWLKGEEDSDPEKQAQYAHWRELSDLQKAQEPSAD